MWLFQFGLFQGEKRTDSSQGVVGVGGDRDTRENLLPEERGEINTNLCHISCCE